MTLLQQTKKQIVDRGVESFRVILDDNRETTVHVARYVRDSVKLRLKLFDTETCLLDWCQQNEVADAIGGGFFLRGIHKPLGDMWIDGFKQPSVAFVSPWDHSRGSMYISPVGGLTIAPRYMLPQQPKSHLLQAGPLLLQEGRSTIVDGEDLEGFSEGASQFDTDITNGRYPRSAIGYNRRYLFTVACDGRNNTEAGLSLQEFSEVLQRIGITDALNLDGGSSATVIAAGKLQNKPRSDCKIYEKGRPIFSAVLLDPVYR